MKRLPLKKALRLEQDRLSRRIIGVLRRRGKDARKYKKK